MNVFYAEIHIIKPQSRFGANTKETGSTKNGMILLKSHQLVIGKIVYKSNNLGKSIDISGI